MSKKKSTLLRSTYTWWDIESDFRTAGFYVTIDSAV